MVNKEALYSKDYYEKEIDKLFKVQIASFHHLMVSRH